ncbi:MAG: hypothetical protein CL947_02380 [Epsilonproteobacteria bacterium]|nr:hypothetical protein [Campylobacterota bacterium]
MIYINKKVTIKLFLWSVFVSHVTLGFWNDNELKPKPPFYKTGSYELGGYMQFNVDTKGFGGAVVAGATFRTLFSIALCGNKLESFKKAVFQPGVAKSLLFWLPAVGTYHFIVNAKTHEFEKFQYFKHRLKKFKPQKPTKTNPFAQYVHFDDDEEDDD